MNLQIASSILVFHPKSETSVTVAYSAWNREVPGPIPGFLTKCLYGGMVYTEVLKASVEIHKSSNLFLGTILNKSTIGGGLAVIDKEIWQPINLGVSSSPNHVRAVQRLDARLITLL